MTVALQILGLTLLLLAAQAILRRAGKWVVWGLFAAVPVVLLPHWLSANQFDLFMWAKGYSVAAFNILVAAVRFTRLGNHEWARRAVPTLVGVNITEAVVVDLAAGGRTHLLNALAGVALVLTLPYRRGAVRVADTPGRDVRVPTSRGWVVAYTLWNWAFVLLNYPEWAGQHAAVLAAALVVGLVAPDGWAQARGFTLGPHLLATATAFTPMRAWLDTSSWADPTLALGVAGAAAAVAVGCGVGAILGLARRRTVGGGVRQPVAHRAHLELPTAVAA